MPLFTLVLLLYLNVIYNSYLVCTYDTVFRGTLVNAGSPALMSCLALFYVDE